MFITINKDGSVYAQSSEFIAFYNDQGKLSCSVSGRNVPEFININDHREKKSPIPAKDESPVKPIKISVDSTDLDKLEAQLKRIEGLMISTGLKQPAKGGFIMNFDATQFNPIPKGYLEPVFVATPGCTLINEAYIEKTTLEKVVVQAAKEGAQKAVEEVRLEITTDINDSREQSAAEIQTGANDEEKELARAIRKLLLKDVAQGGPLSRVLRCSR